MEEPIPVETTRPLNTHKVVVVMRDLTQPVVHDIYTVTGDELLELEKTPLVFHSKMRQYVKFRGMEMAAKLPEFSDAKFSYNVHDISELKLPKS